MLLTFAASAATAALLQLLPVVFWQAKEQNAITRDLKSNNHIGQQMQPPNDQ